MPVATVNLDAAWREHDRAAGALARMQGQVFTPRPLALRLAQATLAPLDAAPTLLDPACGCGALLLGAIEYAASHRPQWLEAWAQGGFAGVDTDAACLRAARIALETALPELRPDLRQADALDLAAEPAWDAIIANPPWVSFSGRHGADLSPARRRLLAGKFAAFAGWPSLHAAFCDRIAALAHPQGRIGLLLPLQVADLAGYAATRAALEKRHRLESLHDLGESAFDGITEPSGMYVFGPGQALGASWQADNPYTDLAPNRRFSPLPPASFGDIGIHSGNAAKLIFTRRHARGLRPVLVGADVQAFAVAAPSLWLIVRKLTRGRYARVPEASRLAQARILLRQTADRPIAARHAPKAMFRNSLLACFGAPGHDDDFLLGVLNSEVMARIHRAMHRDARQRAFPQVKVSHLRALPIPGREVGADYDRIAELSRRVQTGEASARAELEQAVARVFGTNEKGTK